MSRQRGTNIFTLIAKDLFESNAGRIRWRSNMWALIGGKWDRQRISPLGSDIVREDHVLVKRRCVTRCPQPPSDGFYFDSKWWHVPRVDCMKCRYHRASSRGGAFRFPRCVYAKSQKQVVVAAQSLVQLDGMVRKATEEAEKILGGRS